MCNHTNRSRVTCHYSNSHRSFEATHMMSKTTTLLMQESRRTEAASSKQPFSLPIIAPKESDHSGCASSTRDRRGASLTGIPPRTRLPPRSRTGCWTCRTRKVKCDERHPICGQCLRSSHSCDYSARLSFREDTSRVRNRMQKEVDVDGSPVWDRESTESAPPDRANDPSGLPQCK